MRTQQVKGLVGGIYNDNSSLRITCDISWVEFGILHSTICSPHPSVFVQHDQLPCFATGTIDDADIGVAVLCRPLWHGEQPGDAVLMELVRVEDLSRQRHPLHQTATGRLEFVGISIIL